MTSNRKQVSESLKSVLSDKVMMSVLDGNSDITELYKSASTFWESNLLERKPAPALKENGDFKGTDLDLSTFMYSLSGRNAVINIPKYKSMLPENLMEGEMIVSKDNRHGVLVGVTANKESFVFSLKIKDANVMTSSTVGEYRNFAMTGIDGEWYEGWDNVTFMPSGDESDFIEKFKVAVGDSITFSNFVHPNRWVSMYGKHYFITKALQDRMDKEAKFYYAEIKRLQESGISYPEKYREDIVPKVSSKKEAGKSVKFDSLEVEVDFAQGGIVFNHVDMTQEELVRITDLRRKIVYTYLPRLRFATRCTEMAFMKNGFKDNLEKSPAWMKNVKWERDYTQKGKRKKWNRMVLFQPAPGEVGVSIRYRVLSKSFTVALDYKEKTGA